MKEVMPNRSADEQSAGATEVAERDMGLVPVKSLEPCAHRVLTEIAQRGEIPDQKAVSVGRNLRFGCIDQKSREGLMPSLPTAREGNVMLTLTDNATTIVKELSGQLEPEGQAGLRISTEADKSTFAVAVTPAPEPADQVVESSGARVFLEQTAADSLADKVLDASVDAEGGLHFSIGSRA
jgi:iron-sulfur cluster assembly protein